MRVIVPCCGRSSRYPNEAPKWMLPSQDGRPMLWHAISGLECDLNDIVITVLRDHESKYNVREGINAAFGQPITVVVLEDATKSQAETVTKTLEHLDYSGRFLIKDSDNRYKIKVSNLHENAVCVDSLNNFDSINPRNKSYIQVDHNDVITNIREKAVISDLFSVGGYGFAEAGQFREYYDRLSVDATEWNRELYISDIIGAMTLDGVPFRAHRVEEYSDWGTIHEWRRALLAKRTFFVSLDGFVFERGSEYFQPRFDSVKPLEGGVAATRYLARRGHNIVYLSIRAASLSDMTVAQISAADLPSGPVIYNCPIGNWTLVTAPHDTLPISTSNAVEVEPASPNVVGKLLGDL